MQLKVTFSPDYPNEAPCLEIPMRSQVLLHSCVPGFLYNCRTRQWIYLNVHEKWNNIFRCPE
ncbi:hypothetical protein DPMN_026919 [Dreissena polymorpha]|uniref:Uncharacterized protein n=1 Tax=Dreissena polymorpha TaxID=45954 RepID=A0A9D4LUB8_DREPO|nr:hypothetical protein DPMN_026919 [Dreissena polymorpha]